MGQVGRRGRPRAGIARAGAVRVVWTTVPPSKARTVATALVAEGLAACVTAVPGATSVYRWRGKLERAAETLLLVKVAARDVARLASRLRELHPYEVPEVLVFEPESGLAAYLRWVRGAGGPESP